MSTSSRFSKKHNPVNIKEFLGFIYRYRQCCLLHNHFLVGRRGRFLVNVVENVVVFSIGVSLRKLWHIVMTVRSFWGWPPPQLTLSELLCTNRMIYSTLPGLQLLSKCKTIWIYLTSNYIQLQADWDLLEWKG